MQETRVKPHPLKTARTLVLGVALCAAVGLGCFFAGRRSVGEEEKPVRLDAVVLEARLTEISELAVVDYHYTNMVQFENSSDFYGVRLPFTTKGFILTYDGEIKAGVDLRDTGVAVGENAVTVRLPEAKILSHEIDENSLEIFDEKTSIFNPFTVEDFTAFQAAQKAAMEEKAVESGLLEAAAERARRDVALLLRSLLPEEYSLTVR